METLHGSPYLALLGLFLQLFPPVIAVWNFHSFSLSSQKLKSEI